ncbi:MAG: DsbA family protein [Chloroflexi bacterium]|nr:DsbA family protein [Chloroflexota bacterium]
MNEQPTDNTPTRHDRAALGWFGLGVLVGAVATIGLTTLAGTPGATASSANPDLTSIRDAAKQGVQEALREAPLVNAPGITMPISLTDIREAAKQGVQEALQNGVPAAGQQGDESAPVEVDTTGISTRASNTQGEEAATITIIEYSDFQCPYCKRFHSEVLPRIVTDYVKTGKVKFSYKHFAFLGDESLWAAQAAECAADQNRFWDFHELLFTRQSGENVGAFTKDNLISLAKEVKLDSQTFTTCLNDDKTLDRVQADTAEGNKLGVRGTPSFLINGKLLVGAQPYDAFKSAIEAAMK